MLLNIRVGWSFLLAAMIAVTTSGILVQSADASTSTVTWTAGADKFGTPFGVAIQDINEGTLTTPVNTGLGTTANRANIFGTSGYLYFNVATWDASVANARVEVQYWDEAGAGGTRFRLQYLNNSSALTNSAINYAVGTGGIGTAVFYITNVQGFTGTPFNGSDFRILVQDGSRKNLAISKVTVTGTISATPSNSAATVSFDFAQTRYENGLIIKPIVSSGTSGLPTTIEEFNRKSITVDTAGGLFIDVDDGYMFENPSNNDVAIDITYYDKGFGFFYLVYDGFPAESGAVEAQLKNSFGPDLDYQTNNIVYMSNSGQWLTHRFNLYRPFFGNYMLDGRLAGGEGTGADFKIVQPQGTDATNNYALANQNYLLHISAMTMTKSSLPIDVAGTFNGTFANAGEMTWIWTRLASLNEGGHGLYQDEAAKATTAATSIGGKSARQATGGEIYFNINDKYVKNALDANNVPVVTSIIAVEYWDGSTSDIGKTWSLQYESTTGTGSGGTVTLGGTSVWLRKPFSITDGKYGNGLNGNDFKIVSTSSDLYVRDVMFTRPFGSNRTGPIPNGYSATQRVVGTHYFPVFDGNRPTLWEASTVSPAGTGADSYNADSKGFVMANSGYSSRSTVTHAKELTDMRDSGVDFAIVYFHGSTANLPTDAAFAVTQLAATAGSILNGPKLAVMIDEEYVQSETHLRNRATASAFKSDLSDAATRGLLVRQAEDFYSLIPRSQWMTIDGRPLVFLYFHAAATTVGPTSATKILVMKELSDRFFLTHGVRPYIIPDRLWNADGSLSLPVEEYFSWGPGICCDNTYTAGFAQANVFSVGPGFSDHANAEAGHPVARTRSRENGDFYKRGWERAIAKGNHMVIVDTWNYFAEGTTVAETREYGRTYLALTKTYADTFKAANYATGSSSCTGTLTVCVKLGTTNTNLGLMQDDQEGMTTTAVAGVGRRAVGSSLVFSVDDSFLNSVVGGAAVTISIDYIDSGPTFFDVKYDASGNSSKKIGSVDIKNSNTGQAKTASFIIGDAFFANRDVGANDFRFDADKANSLVIKEVRISKTASVAVPTVPSSWKRTYIGIGTRNVGGW